MKYENNQYIHYKCSLRKYSIFIRNERPPILAKFSFSKFMQQLTLNDS